jgi:hypothetical protein
MLVEGAAVPAWTQRERVPSNLTGTAGPLTTKARTALATVICRLSNMSGAESRYHKLSVGAADAA